LAGGAAALPLLHGCGGGDEVASTAMQASRGKTGLMAAAGRVYQTGSGGTIYGGRFSNSLLDLIAAAPANSWVQLNQNTLNSVWAPPDYVPIYVSGPGDTTAVMRAWSGFGWDAKRSRLILYGGGHANYDGNEVYVFDAQTRRWSLGLYPTDVKEWDLTKAERITMDGPLRSPVSAHTYDNNGYLEVLDRFITFGGAAAHVGGAYQIHGDGPSRNAGPYTLDLSLAGRGMVGGLSDTNVKRGTSAGVSLAGAQAWSMRDYYKDHPDPNGVLRFLPEHISCGTAYTVENGHDVVYITSRPGLHLHRIEFVDSDYRNDLISRAGNAGNNPPQWDNTVALDPENRVILIMGDVLSGTHFWGWDISGPPKDNFLVKSGGLTGPGVTAWLAAFSNKHGLDYDSVNRRFVMWSEGGQVFAIKHLDGALNVNWYIEELRPNTGTAGVDRPKTRAELDAEPVGIYSKSDSATLGKWKWAKDLNAFVGLQHNYNGNVWVYKPSNWVRPA